MSDADRCAAAVDFALAIAAGPYFYSQGPGRCDPVHSGYADCSGLVVASLNAVGIHTDALNSWAQASACHATRSGISLEDAAHTKGALFFVGCNEGRDGCGINRGHVAISLGDGVNVVEARNHRAGILTGPIARPYGWDYCALPRPWFPSLGVRWQHSTQSVAQPQQPTIAEESVPIMVKEKGTSGEWVTAEVVNGVLFVTGQKANPFREGAKGDMAPWPYDKTGTTFVCDLKPFMPEGTILKGFPATEHAPDGPGSWVIMSLEPAAGKWVVRKKTLHRA